MLWPSGSAGSGRIWLVCFERDKQSIHPIMAKVYSLGGLPFQLFSKGTSICETFHLTYQVIKHLTLLFSFPSISNVSQHPLCFIPATFSLLNHFSPPSLTVLTTRQGRSTVLKYRIFLFTIQYCCSRAFLFSHFFSSFCRNDTEQRLCFWGTVQSDTGPRGEQTLGSYSNSIMVPPPL